MFKVVQAIKDNMRKQDTASKERLELNRVRASIEYLCEEHLLSINDVVTFEALPSALDATLAVLSSDTFTRQYDYVQLELTLFRVRLRAIDVF